LVVNSNASACSRQICKRRTSSDGILRARARQHNVRLPAMMQGIRTNDDGEDVLQQVDATQPPKGARSSPGPWKQPDAGKGARSNWAHLVSAAFPDSYFLTGPIMGGRLRPVIGARVLRDPP
jgi:hypothetical protein